MRGSLSNMRIAFRNGAGALGNSFMSFRSGTLRRRLDRYRMVATAFLTAFLMLPGWWASAQDTSAQEKRKKQLEQEISLINEKLSETNANSRNALSSLALVNKKIENRKELLAQSRKTERAYSDRIYLKQREINKMQSRLDTLSSHYEKLVLSAYRHRDTRLWYMYILSSEDLGQAYRRYGYFKSLSSSIAEESRKVIAAKEELEKERNELSALKNEAAAVSASISAELKSLEKDQAQAQKLVTTLNRQKSKYNKQLEAKRSEVRRLNAQIESMLRSAVRSGKNSSSASKNKTVIDEKLDAEFSKNKGKLPWPVEGVIVERFGQNYHPVYKNVKLPYSNGISIETRKNEAVHAIFDGEVQQIVVVPGYNQCVLVRHGSYFSFYCKLKNVSVKAGQKVKVGEVIGTVDTIGGDTQLHIQIWKEMTPQNPELWLK